MDSEDRKTVLVESKKDVQAQLVDLVKSLLPGKTLKIQGCCVQLYITREQIDIINKQWCAQHHQPICVGCILPNKHDLERRYDCNLQSYVDHLSHTFTYDEPFTIHIYDTVKHCLNFSKYQTSYDPCINSVINQLRNAQIVFTIKEPNYLQIHLVKKQLPEFLEICQNKPPYIVFGFLLHPVPAIMT
jgi:hypothetical protein